MGDSPRTRRRSRFLLLATCAAVVLLVAACGNSGEPTDYDDTVEDNFMRGCEVAAEADPAIRPVAPKYCGCAYERLVTEISFDDFKSLDDDVKDDPDKIRADEDDSTGAALTGIFADCRAIHGRG